MKQAFTLIEIIVTIIILAIISTGTLISVQQLYIRVAKSKIISNLSSDSQVISDQISSILYDRVPSSVIGYSSDGNFSSIYSLNTDFKILEWIGTLEEAMKAVYYSGFVDIDKSQKETNTIISFDINSSAIESMLKHKFGNIISNSDLAVIFAGTFDDGLLTSSNDFNNSFGWHGHEHNQTYNIILHDNNITLLERPKEIYEKYYLIDTAYGVARGDSIDLNATCIKDLNQNVNEYTLFLFYNYRPWKTQTFCADTYISHHETKEGNVTILSQNVKGFQAGLINDCIYFNLSLEKSIKGSQNSITVSKQKVVF